MKVILCAALLTLASASCRERSTAVSAPAMPSDLVLRTYEVPNDGAAQVQTVLKSVMWFGSDGKDSNKYVGRADVTPDDRLVVLANEGVQEGVRTLLTSMGKSPPKPRPAIELSYWLVRGVPAGKDATRPPSLGEVKAALDEVDKADGPQQFALEEKLAITSLSGEEAKVQGRFCQVRHVVTRTSEGVSAEVKLFTRGSQSIETRLKLAPGQLAVLGSSGAGQNGKDDPSGSLYYLVRATLHDGQGR